MSKVNKENLLADLTPDEKKRLIALDHTVNCFMAECLLADDVLPFAKELLDFLETGDYEREEADVVSGKFPKEVK